MDSAMTVISSLEIHVSNHLIVSNSEQRTARNFAQFGKLLIFSI